MFFKLFCSVILLPLSLFQSFRCKIVVWWVWCAGGNELRFIEKPIKQSHVFHKLFTSRTGTI